MLWLKVPIKKTAAILRYKISFYLKFQKLFATVAICMCWELIFKILSKITRNKCWPRSRKFKDKKNLQYLI